MNNMFNNGSRKQTISLYVCKKQRTWNSVWLETNLFIPYVYKIQCFLTYRINFNLTRSSHPIFGSARSSHLAKSSRSQLRVGKFIHVFQPGLEVSNVTCHHATFQGHFALSLDDASGCCLTSRGQQKKARVLSLIQFEFNSYRNNKQ